MPQSPRQNAAEASAAKLGANKREQNLPHSIQFRKPSLSHARPIWRMVQSSTLDTNSCYAYLLLCKDFAETCLVAEEDGKLIAFVMGYIPPARPNVFFVWQIATAPEARGRGLGKELLRQVIAADACADVRYMEATVTPSNNASRRLFQSMANEWGAPFNVGAGFGRNDFGDEDHEEEELIRIGPLP